MSNTPHLLELVREKFDGHQVDLVKPSLKSVSWKLAQAEFHIKESKKALNDALPNEVDLAGMLKIAGWFGGHDKDKFQLAGFAAEAHLIAFAQSLHSVTDIAAQVIIYALNLNNTSKLSNKSGIRKVIDHFTKMQLYPELLNAINNLLQSQEFLYLEAYVNTTKHRTLIENTFKLNLATTNGQQYGIELSSFSFKGNDFPSKRADDFTGEIYMKVSAAIRNVGSVLNEIVQSSP